MKNQTDMCICQPRIGNDPETDTSQLGMEMGSETDMRLRQLEVGNGRAWMNKQSLQSRLADKRFLFALHSLGVGGAQKIAAFVMNNLIEYGSNVTVVSRCEERENISLSNKVERLFLRKGMLPPVKKVRKKVEKNVKDILQFKKIIENEKPDYLVIFGPDPMYNIANSLAKHSPTIIECERGDLESRRRLNKIFLKHYMKHADAGVFQMDGGVERYGKSIPNNIHIIPNPCYVPEGIQRNSDSVKNAIVSGGRLVAEKGFDILIKAFALISNKFPSIDLHIYGSGEEKERLLGIIDSLSLMGRVRILDPVRDFPSILKQARLFVLPSYFEGLPNTLIEAMALGVPVVAADCTPGGARFLTDHGTIGGPLVPPGDPGKMAKAIEMMLRDPVQAERLGEAGKIICDLYSPSAISDLWLDLFVNCLQ